MLEQVENEIVELKAFSSGRLIEAIFSSREILSSG